LRYDKVSPSGKEIRQLIEKRERIDGEMRRTGAKRKRDQSLEDKFDAGKPKKLICRQNI
jgi:hypothetical protein